MPQISIGTYNLTYTILHRKRKTVTMKVLSPSKLQLFVPIKFSASQAEKIILGKSSWILTSIAKLSAAENNPLNSKIADGYPLLYQGKEYRLSLHLGTPGITLCESQILVFAPSTLDATQILYQWYVAQAELLIKNKVTYWANKTGLISQKIILRDQRTRWGSCSVKGNLNFNWRIVMAPDPVVDYLIIHELCHLKEMNHSQKYWNLVAIFSPQWKKQREWLKLQGPILCKLFPKEFPKT